MSLRPAEDRVSKHLRERQQWTPTPVLTLLPEFFPVRGMLQTLLREHKQIVSECIPLETTATVQEDLFLGTNPSSHLSYWC